MGRDYIYNTGNNIIFHLKQKFGLIIGKSEKIITHNRKPILPQTPTVFRKLYKPTKHLFFPQVIIMKTVFADVRGRIIFGTKFLHRYGRKFAVISAPKEIVLVPIAKDPLARLREIGKESGIDKYTLKELKAMAREEAEREIGKNVR